MGSFIDTWGQGMEQIVVGLEDCIQRTGAGGFLEKIGLTPHSVAQGSVCFGLAFLGGFFFKKYFKMLLGGFIIATLVYLVLHYNQVIVVDWNTIAAWFGLENVACDINSLISWALNEMRAHLFAVSLTTIGFLLGYKWG